MQRNKLIILCGLPFAGKSTLARELVAKLGWLRVDLDVINTERGLGGQSNDAITPEDWKITYDISYQRTEDGLRSGKTVMNDTANFTREQRDKLRAIAEKAGCQTVVIYVNTPDEVARKRWQDNRKTHIRYDVTDEDFAEVADHFEKPDEDENVIHYVPQMTVDMLIQDLNINEE